MSRDESPERDTDVMAVSSGRGSEFEPVDPGHGQTLGPTFEPVTKPLPPAARERRQLGLVAAVMVIVLALGVLLTTMYLATSPPVDLSRPLPPIVNSDTDDAATDAEELPDWPTLVPGDSGRPVRAAQLLLRASGQNLQVTGRYGGETTQALARFVRQAGLDSRTLDGTTWPFLVRPLTPGASGQRVRALQVLMKGNDVKVPVNGNFGGAMRGAVRLVQVQNGLEATGLAGRPTWRVLAAGAGPLNSPRGSRG